MPRRARHYIPGHPYHIFHRGNNREKCFFEADNYQRYLELWQKLSKRHGVRVHAYCLMADHIHILATPETKESISKVMKIVGSCYTQYVNMKHLRTGTLWEGRHRSSLIQSEKYLLSCYRYIELNPVRAGVVSRPEEYKWSSYSMNGSGKHDWLDCHEEYLRLGGSAKERSYAYRELFNDKLSEEELGLIRKATHYSQPVGDDEFRTLMASKYGIKLGYMKRGRPAKQMAK